MSKSKRAGGLGWDWGGVGGQSSEVITAAFLDKGTTSPSFHLPSDGC